MEAGERRADSIGDRGPQAGREPLALRGGPAVRGPGARGPDARERGQERPVLVGARQQLGQDVRHAIHGGAAGHEALRERPPQGRRVCVRVGGHRAPALEHGGRLGWGGGRLVLTGLEQVDRDPVERVHVPGEQPAVDEREVGTEPFPEGGQRDGIAAALPLAGIEGRPRRAPPPAPGSRHSGRGRPPGRRAWDPGGGRRTAGRRASSRTAGSSRGRRPSRSPRARRWVGWLQVRSWSRQC